LSLIRGTFVYYLVLLIGTGFLGVYFWIILTAAIPDVMVKLAFFLSGLILMISTFALAAAKSRSGRTILTILSGLVGGTHAYMDIVLFPDWMYGTLMFFWLLFGLLLSCAAFAWLPETD
jgi:hypothetical protein